jgi:hypothetical protein
MTAASSSSLSGPQNVVLNDHHHSSAAAATTVASLIVVSTDTEIDDDDTTTTSSRSSSVPEHEQQQQVEEEVVIVPNAHKAMECRSSALSLIQYRSTRGRLLTNQQQQRDFEGEGEEQKEEAVVDDDDDDVALPVIRLVQKRKKPKLSRRAEKASTATATTTSKKTRIKDEPSVSTYNNSNSNNSKLLVPEDKRQPHMPTARIVTTRPEKQQQQQQQQQQQRTSGADLPYESALQALQAYHAIHGDLIMPRRFVVPFLSHDDNDEHASSSSTQSLLCYYPTEWHGVDLASAVYNMQWWQKNVKQRPKRVAQLNQLGFCWERLQPEWNLVLQALCTYRSVYGHVMVPIHFVVPRDYNATSAVWPKATWGIPLGSSVYRIRSRDDFLRGCCPTQAASRRRQLDGLGFCWDVGEERFQKFYRILLHYAQLQQQQQRIGAAGGRAAAPTTIAINQNMNNQPLRIPSTYVVPKNKNDWPNPEYWNYPLGAKCTAVRQKQLYIKGKPERKRKLAEIGFLYWNTAGNADLGWLHVVHAAAIFSRMHQRKLNVPYHFVVPAPPPTTTSPIMATAAAATAPLEIDNGNNDVNTEDWPWPEHLWGLPLGQRLKDVRTKGAYLKGKHGPMRRQQLDTLGFDWKPRRGRPPKIQ